MFPEWLAIDMAVIAGAYAGAKVGLRAVRWLRESFSRSKVAKILTPSLPLIGVAACYTAVIVFWLANGKPATKPEIFLIAIANPLILGMYALETTLRAVQFFLDDWRLRLGKPVNLPRQVDGLGRNQKDQPEDQSTSTARLPHSVNRVEAVAGTKKNETR